MITRIGKGMWRTLAVLVLAVSVAIGAAFAAPAQPASAGSQGISGSACSYLGQYCGVFWAVDAPGTYLVEFYTKFGGYYAYWSGYVTCAPRQCSLTKYIRPDERVDSIVVSGPGTVWGLGVVIWW